MNIESTNFTSINPKRRTILSTNNTASKAKLLEVQRMVIVDHMTKLLRKLSAKWVSVEVAVIAAVHEAVNGIVADVTASVNEGSDLEVQSEKVVVEAKR